MNCGGEYAGDAAAKRGRASGSPAHRVGLSFSDRQDAHPGISRRHLERLHGLVEGGPRIAAVGILRQRRIGEVENVNVKVNGQRARREMTKCGPGGTGWIGDECLAGGHVQAEPVSLLPLPVGAHARIDPEPCHLIRRKQRPRTRNCP